jgi:hypothetical protein
VKVFEGKFLGFSVVGNGWARRPEQISHSVGLEYSGGHPGNGDRSKIEWLTASGEATS